MLTLESKPSLRVLRALRGQQVRWGSLGERDREYCAAWDSLPEDARLQLAAQGVTGPLLPECSREETPAAPLPSSNDAPLAVEYDAAESVLRVLQILTSSHHPSLRLAADCLLLIINRSDEKNEAAVAKKHGITRAAVSKRIREMRKGRFLDGFEIHYFGGRRADSERARVRALRVHKQRKQQCKHQPQAKQAALSLLSEL
ncbi:MAG: hypothetical protein IAE94_01830 [Chthoniobacterales bacterium]|nr:hypothetical protein [Chthoniobacterales bacterium]